MPLYYCDIVYSNLDKCFEPENTWNENATSAVCIWSIHAFCSLLKNITVCCSKYVLCVFVCTEIKTANC